MVRDLHPNPIQKMTGSTLDRPRDETISMLWPPSPPTPRTPSSANTDSFSDIVAQDSWVWDNAQYETIPILWQPMARPCSSVYSDDLSLEELVKRVDESVIATQLDTIERLTQDNRALREELVLHRRTYHNFMDLFDGVLDLALQIRSTIGEYDRGITVAEEGWLASWGIAWI